MDEMRDMPGTGAELKANDPLEDFDRDDDDLDLEDLDDLDLDDLDDEEADVDLDEEEARGATVSAEPAPR